MAKECLGNEDLVIYNAITFMLENASPEFLNEFMCPNCQMTARKISLRLGKQLDREGHTSG